VDLIRQNKLELCEKKTLSQTQHHSQQLPPIFLSQGLCEQLPRQPMLVTLPAEESPTPVKTNDISFKHKKNAHREQVPHHKHPFVLLGNSGISALMFVRVRVRCAHNEATSKHHVDRYCVCFGGFCFAHE
jgi:hypothetical protein